MLLLFERECSVEFYLIDFTVALMNQERKIKTQKFLLYCIAIHFLLFEGFEQRTSGVAVSDRSANVCRDSNQGSLVVWDRSANRSTTTTLTGKNVCFL